MEKNKKIGFYLHISEEEQKIIKSLKCKYCINVSKLIKNFLFEYYKKVEQGEKNGI
jgi:hypothetical protein